MINMIMGFCLSFVMMGTALLLNRYFIPISDDLMSMMFELMGFGIIFIAVIILAGRNKQTGAGLFLDLPNVDDSISIHSDIANKRLDPNAKFIKLKNIGLGMYKGRKTVFKNTGGGFRIAGHNIVRTHEKLAADLPEWLGQYLHQVKDKYLVKNDEELFGLYKQLKNIQHNKDIENIEILKPLLKDDRKRMELLTMDLEKLKRMEETLFDGETVHMEDVEHFIKLTSPQELDTWIDQEVNKEEREKKRYRDPGVNIDWNKWLPALGMFAFIAMLGTVILISYLD